MMRKFSLVLPVAVFFIHALENNSKYKPNLSCGVLVKSTCADDETSDWNRNSVGQNLKNWIQSITEVDTMSKQENYKFFRPKSLMTFKDNAKNEYIKMIGKRDCPGDKTTEAVWKKPSTFSSKQFQDGFVYGVENEAGEMTGDNIIYVYPDMETALIGRFENGVMIRAMPTKIMKERCKDGIKEIKVAKPKKNAPTYTYNRPNRLRIGDQPTIMDHLEKKNTYIGQGKKDDGVFAKKDFKKGDVIMYYSGLFWNITEQALYTRDMYKNQTMDEYWSIHRNLMNFQGKLVIHIPEEYWNISNYRATLGHKINHSFIHGKSNFGFAYHPRFGEIRCLYATADIAKGEEILTNYGYRIGGHRVPDWYRNLYEEETGKKWITTEKPKQLRRDVNSNPSNCREKMPSQSCKI